MVHVERYVAEPCTADTMVKRRRVAAEEMPPEFDGQSLRAHSPTISKDLIGVKVKAVNKRRVWNGSIVGLAQGSVKIRYAKEKYDELLAGEGNLRLITIAQNGIPDGAAIGYAYKNTQLPLLDSLASSAEKAKALKRWKPKAAQQVTSSAQSFERMQLAVHVGNNGCL